MLRKPAVMGHLARKTEPIREGGLKERGRECVCVCVCVSVEGGGGFISNLKTLFLS